MNPRQLRQLLQHAGTQIDVVIDRPAAGAGPAVVLLPSSQRDSLDFDDLAGRIAQAGFVVLRPQPRGMGRSSEPADGLTLNHLAQDVAVVVEQLGAGRAVLVGHAYGHFVARVADLNHPHLVRGVVALGAAARVFPAGMVEALAIASDPQRQQALRLEKLRLAMFAPGNDARPWLAGWYPQWREVYRKAATVPGKDQWWPVANAPLLDLQGAEDPWRPAATRSELKDVLGDKVTVRVIPGASHALVPERPAAVAREIVDWVGTLPP
ncbi:MAG TPA: alpha/beta hydrolase [Ideonella sp.]|nr:alpha/beta hydrolase [Ideonella sp.]